MDTDIHRDQDVWDTLRARGHAIGPAHVDDDGVLWVLVDGTPLSIEAARPLVLEDGPATSIRSTSSSE